MTFLEAVKNYVGRFVNEQKNLVHESNIRYMLNGKVDKT